jgi:transposase, IS5 family
VLRLPEELARVDALLDDPAFFAPFAPHFHPVIGRPSTSAEWYLAADVPQAPVPAGV